MPNHMTGFAQGLVRAGGGGSGNGGGL
jgi:hypothetical protein